MSSFIEELAHPSGVLLRSEAVAHGVDDPALHRLTRARQLVRLRQGAYALATVFDVADRLGRHLLLIEAVRRQYRGRPVALSHSTSLLAQGGPDYRLRLDDGVHLTHLSGNGRRQSRVVHHRGECRIDDLRRLGDDWATVPARAVLEVAATDGARAGVVQASHFLHTAEMNVDQLRRQAQLQNRWPGSLAHHVVLHLATDKLESVGEAATWHLFFDVGLKLPTPQCDISDDRGFVGRVDFAWLDRRVLVEFDGMVKYHRFRRRGETIEEMVTREKIREDRLREAGWTVVRLVWGDLSDGAAVRRRIERAFATASQFAGGRRTA